MPVEGISSQQNIFDKILNESEQKEKRSTGVLGKDDFLSLLITQLQHQDPLKPVEDKEFIAQMAQFSSLEQMQNLNKNMENVKAFSLIGRYVCADMSEKTEQGIKFVEGYATGVRMENGKAYVMIDDKSVPVEKITDVYSDNPTTAYL